MCVMLYSPHISPRELPHLSLVFPSLRAVGKEHILSSGQSMAKMVLQQTHHAGSFLHRAVCDHRWWQTRGKSWLFVVQEWAGD